MVGSFYYVHRRGNNKGIGLFGPNTRILAQHCGRAVVLNNNWLRMVEVSAMYTAGGS